IRAPGRRYLLTKIGASFMQEPQHFNFQVRSGYHRGQGLGDGGRGHSFEFRVSSFECRRRTAFRLRGIEQVGQFWASFDTFKRCAREPVFEALIAFDSKDADTLRCVVLSAEEEDSFSDSGRVRRRERMMQL